MIPLSLLNDRLVAIVVCDILHGSNRVITGRQQVVGEERDEEFRGIDAESLCTIYRARELYMLIFIQKYLYIKSRGRVPICRED